MANTPTFKEFTTPILKFKVAEHLIAEKDIYVTISDGFDDEKDLVFRSGDPALVITEQGEDTYFDLTLTQEQTAAFGNGTIVALDVNWMDGSIRHATNDIYYKVTRNLLKRILP